MKLLEPRKDQVVVDREVNDVVRSFDDLSEDF